MKITFIFVFFIFNLKYRIKIKLYLKNLIYTDHYNIITQRIYK